jgi:uncharacterized membrane protein
MNSDKLTTILGFVRVALVVVGVGSSLFLFSGPNVNDGTEAVEAFREGGKLSTAILFTMGIILASVGLVFLFFFTQLATNTKKTVMSIIGLLIAVVVYLVFLGIGTSDTSETLLLKNPVEDSTVVSTTAGIITVGLGILVGGSLLVYDIVMGFFRK